jgi:hypothetical protein
MARERDRDRDKKKSMDIYGDINIGKDIERVRKQRKKERKNGINSKVREGKIRKFLKIKRR